MFVRRLPDRLIPRMVSSASWLLALAMGLRSGLLYAQMTEQDARFGGLQSEGAAAAAKNGLATPGTSGRLLTVHAVEFAPIDSSTTFEALPIGVVTQLRETTSGTALLAPVHLPSGAVIDEIILHACDASATSVGSVTLYDCIDDPIPGSCTGLASVSTVAAVGCSTWPSGSIGVTVQNLTDDYTLRTDWPNDPNLGLRAVKVLYHLQVSPAPGTATFNDVATSHPFFQYIEALSASGITGGCQASPPLYCPDDPLTRGQMAVFLAKALGLNWPF
jgi:hypothetical protein